MQFSRRSVLSMLAGAASLSAAKTAREYWVYFGTYTRKNSKGIYVSRLDVAKGSLGEPQLAAEIANPSFLAIHPNGRNVYSVSESGEKGSVTSFSIDRASGKLTKINQASSGGAGPCHLNVDRAGRTLVVANYGGGSVASLPVKPDGSLGEPATFIQHQGSSVNRQRQQGPHAHSANISRDNRFAVVADLGLDQVLVYRLDPATSKLTPNQPPFTKVNPGAGPRHFTFHPRKPFAYVINEIQSTVTALRWDGKRGTLTEIASASTLPEGAKPPSQSTAEVLAHPNGKYLYGSNRGHNSIAVFAIQPDGGVRLIDNTSTQGEIPRNFALDPTGRWLFAANQNSDNVVGFSIDTATGRLKPTGQSLRVDVPVCIRFAAV